MNDNPDVLALLRSSIQEFEKMIETRKETLNMLKIKYEHEDSEEIYEVKVAIEALERAKVEAELDFDQAMEGFR